MTPLTQALIKRCFTGSSSVLMMNGVPVAAVAKRFGTPLFVYCRTLLDRQLESLRAALPPDFEIYYSVKANPNPAILCHFVLRGCGLEVASDGELHQALASGCAPDRIVFAGPGKTDDELELAIKTGIGEIHIESHNEARRIVSLCERHQARSAVAIRVNPSSDAQGGAMRMGGKAAPFGVDEEALDPLLQYVLSNSCFQFRGIHISAGTQILDHSILLGQYRKYIAIARSVATRSRQVLQTVDFGGGLGIPYFDGDRELDLDSFRSDLLKLMEETRRDKGLEKTRFLLEPGRFLVGEAGIYVGRVVDIKESRGKKFLILDGGMNHHLAASGNLGQTIKRNYPIVSLEKLDQTAEEIVDVVGPLCTPLDTLGRSVSLPKAEIGDLIGILQSGAYARTASPVGFLSHATPAEALIDDGAMYLVRSRSRVADTMHHVHIPPFLQPEQFFTADKAGD